MKLHARPSLAIFVFTLGLVASDPSAAEDAKTFWTSVLKNCASSDLNGNKILYFGPSNNIGPGSIWLTGADGGYQLRTTVTDTRALKAFLVRGTPTACSATSTTELKASAVANLEPSLGIVSGDLSIDLKKAKSLEVQADSIAWDLLQTAQYEHYVKHLRSDSIVRDDLDRGGRLVLSRALRVTGYTASLEFSDSDAAALKAKYSGPLPKAITGEFGGKLSASWTSNNTLKLSSKSDFYIAGELSPYKSSGFAANGTPFGAPVDIDKSKPVTVDMK